MSKIALEGNASGTGTFTIASPNSNSNFTLNLPTSSGTVVVTGGAQTIEFAAGTAAAPSITFTGDTNTGIFSPGADTIAFAEGGAEIARFDSSGNFGIGTTSPSSKLHVVGSSLTNTLRITDGTNYTICAGYLGSGNVGLISTLGGSASLAFGTDSTERMRIDSEGDVGIGTNNPARLLDLYSTDATKARVRLVGTTNYILNEFSNTGGDFNIGIDNSTGGGFSQGNYSRVLWSNGAYPMVFSTNGTERVRITSGGYFKASNSGAYLGSTSPYHEMRQSAADTILELSNTNTSTPFGMRVQFTGATPNNTTQYFLSCDDSTNIKAIIYSNGTYGSRTGTYGLVSDIKLKQDVVDASSQWDDIKALRIVKYRLKDEVAADPNYPAYIGVIAQEVEQVSPGLVEDCADFENVEVTDEEGNITTERRETGTVTKSVKTSIIYMKAVKALQEAMTRIEALEAEVAALKGQ